MFKFFGGKIDRHKKKDMGHGTARKKNTGVSEESYWQPSWPENATRAAAIK